MGFANTSCSFTRFRILDPVPADTLNQIPELLLKYSFQDIEDIPEMRAHGWVSFEDMLDVKWEQAPPFKGEFAVFSLRLDTRRIPAGVIKKHVALAIRAEKQKLAENGQKFISRERKKELREQVLIKLRDRFLPVPAEFNTVWNLQSGSVWFASTQQKMVDLFMDFFLTTFGLHLEQLTPYNLAATLLGDDQGLDRINSTSFAGPANA